MKKLYVYVVLSLLMTGLIIGNAAALVINEVHADPDAELGDADSDGIVSSSGDEFIEFLNDAATSLDMSGWSISDEIKVRHVFPEGTMIPAGCPVVVFGSESSTGTLGLNNAGDTITLSDKSGNTIAVMAYASEAGYDQSLTRYPDITGSFVKHSEATQYIYSPGLMADKSMFSECKTGDDTGDEQEQDVPEFSIMTTAFLLIGAAAFIINKR